MNNAQVIYIKPFVDCRRMAEAQTYEAKLEAALAIFNAAKKDLQEADEAIETAEVDSHDCRILRTKVGFVERITTECLYDESGCSAGAGAGPLMPVPALAKLQAG